MLGSSAVQKRLRVSSYCFLIESCDNRDLRFEPWRCTIDYNTSRSQEILAILNIYKWNRNNHISSLKPQDQERDKF